jgi:hypothetical protein
MDVTEFIREARKFIERKEWKPSSIYFRYVEFIQKENITPQLIHLKALAALLNYNPKWAEYRYEELKVK